MMRETEKNEQATSDYGIIFEFLGNNEESADVQEIRTESEEINELRKIVLELSEPSRQLMTSSSLSPCVPENINLQFSN